MQAEPQSSIPAAADSAEPQCMRRDIGLIGLMPKVVVDPEERLHLNATRWRGMAGDPCVSCRSRRRASPELRA